MHSATCRRRERRPDRHGHHGRGILQRECERHLDDARNGAWSFADLAGGTPEQCGRLLAPFLRKSGTPLAGFCSSEPGGSANAASPPPGQGVRTIAKLQGDRWVINGRKKWVSSATGWDRKGADILCVVCRTAPDARPQKAISLFV